MVARFRRGLSAVATLHEREGRAPSEARRAVCTTGCAPLNLLWLPQTVLQVGLQQPSATRSSLCIAMGRYPGCGAAGGERGELLL